MSRYDKVHEQLLRDLATLRLAKIAEIYREVLDEAARKNAPLLETLAALMAEESATRAQRALQRRLRAARLPKPKFLADYEFEFPTKIPKQKILRLFDCQFIEQRQCAVFMGGTGTGKSHLLVALGYAASEKGVSVCYARVVDMINALTLAQINGTLQKALKEYVNPSLLLLDELGYLPVDKRGADLLFQVVAARYESGSIVLTTNRRFRDWGKYRSQFRRGPFSRSGRRGSCGGSGRSGSLFRLRALGCGGAELKSRAEVQRRWADRQLGDRHPEIEYVACPMATEALEEVDAKVGREWKSSGWGRLATDGARPAPLIADNAARLVVNQLEDLPHCDCAANRGVVQTHHDWRAAAALPGRSIFFASIFAPRFPVLSRAFCSARCAR